jgi:hypothetical protein
MVSPEIEIDCSIKSFETFDHGFERAPRREWATGEDVVDVGHDTV